jgi:uncharacterized RDD family membrane protein YckC
MHWYYAEEGVQVGPLTESEFEDLVRLGKIDDQTIVWRDGLSEWQPYGRVRMPYSVSASQPISSTPALRCTECKREFPQDELIRYQNSWICTVCKPIFFQRLREGVPAPGAMNYAGFWIRFGAKFIDGLIIWVVQMAAMLLFAPMLGLDFFSSEPPTNFAFLLIYPFMIALSIFYSVWFVGKYGATPGKMALGLKIVTSSGDSISYMKALARFFAEIVSAIVCYIGYIMAAFDEQKKSLHDQICDTRVIRK